MVKRFLAFGLVAVLSLGFLSACGSSSNSDKTPVSTPAQSSNAPAIFTATAQSEIEDSWTPTPTVEHEEETEEPSEGPSGPVEIQIESVDIAFDQQTLQAPAGTDFTITLTNNGAAEHDFQIVGTDFSTSLVAGGSSETITVNLPAGEYRYICSVPGHEAAGMFGTLRVTEGGAPAPGGGEPTKEPEGDATEAATEATTGGSAPVAPGETVALNIESVDIAYDTKELAGPANTDFTITLTNNGTAQHDFIIEGTDFKTELVNAGQSETITVNLPAGEYVYYCSVPGHRPAGMQGILTITEGGGASMAPSEETATEEPAGAATQEATPDAAGGAPVELQIGAVDIAYDTKELQAPAGVDFTITLTNNGTADHDFIIEGTDFKTEMVMAGGSQTITVNLPAGEYTFYCSVPGHRPSGMEGKLIVTEQAAPAGGEAAAGGAPVSVNIEAVDIAFSTKELSGPAGVDFTITLTNNGTAQHDFIIEGTDFKTELINAGQSATITVNLPPGEYVFYCSVPGHRPAGMQGTLKIG